MSKRWTAEDDEFLARWGETMSDGYVFVASHDLDRSRGAGRRRIQWLRKHKPELIAAMADELAAFEAKVSCAGAVRPLAYISIVHCFPLFVSGALLEAAGLHRSLSF